MEYLHGWIHSIYISGDQPSLRKHLPTLNSINWSPPTWQLCRHPFDPVDVVLVSSMSIQNTVICKHVNCTVGDAIRYIVNKDGEKYRAQNPEVLPTKQVPEDTLYLQELPFGLSLSGST